MGKFDLDDIMREFGDHDPDAPKEPGSDGPGAEMFDRKEPGEVSDCAGEEAGSAISRVGTPGNAGPLRQSSNDAGTPPASQPTHNALARPGDVGQVLIHRGVITPEQHTSALRVLKQSPGRQLGEVLIEMGAADADVQKVCAESARLPFERIDATSDEAYDHKALHRLSVDFCSMNKLVPLRYEGPRLVVATARADDVFMLDDVKRRLGIASVKHVLAPASDIEALFERLNESDAHDYDVDEILADVDEDDVEVVESKPEDDPDLEAADSSPVVRYVNHIIQTAMKEGASDIHVEPDERTMRVRFRIDGVLFEMMNPPRKMHAALTSRLKIMANLDIAEKRLPQDGRIRVTVLGRNIDLRMSTVPTPKGEKTVLRILDDRSIDVTLDQLGFSEDALTIWSHQIDQPHGIVLVTGPTGSGKTTTLYSSLKKMDLRKLNVSTVEDPVEYNLNGITQIQTHEKIGMTFAAALKSLLRQDPDVVMLGEIRDLETATIAIQASLTGHLVLSTLHTNDAPSSITRLINIGIESFLIGAAVNAVLAQRLVRKICAECAAPVPVNEDIAEFLQMHGIVKDTVIEGAGCGTCRDTGYAGRVGLYELLVLDDHIRDEIARSPNVTEFRRICCERGMTTLRQDGFEKVAAGKTTVAEVLRVTESTI